MLKGKRILEQALSMKQIGLSCILLAVLSVLVAAAGCRVVTAEPTGAPPTGTTATTLPGETITPYLATPVSQFPAAGICARFETEIVTVTVYPDIPDPRCVEVSPRQKLALVNHTEAAIQVVLGLYEARLEPGEEYLFDRPFGEYLEPGVHTVLVSPCCGPSLWLKSE